jgi:hypothetical protein
VADAIQEADRHFARIKAARLSIRRALDAKRAAGMTGWISFFLSTLASQFAFVR